METNFRRQSIANQIMRGLITAAASVSVSGTGLIAEPVVESYDRMEIDWAKFTMRYYGEAQPAQEVKDLDFKKAEIAARQDSHVYFQKTLPQLFLQKAAPSGGSSAQQLTTEADEAAERVASKLRSVVTTYFPSGKVRVQMEAPLSDALFPKSLRFAAETAAPEAGESGITGVLIRANAQIKPKALYEIIDETGAPLLQASQISEAAFRKNLMGRWYKKPSPHEIKESVGERPATVKATINDKGQFVIPRAEWNAAVSGSEHVLSAARLAVALP